MTEQPPTSGSDATAERAEANDQPLRTGVPAVDQVLRDIDALADLPLEEHLARFERAHESLRSALDADPGEPGRPA